MESMNDGTIMNFGSLLRVCVSQRVRFCDTTIMGRKFSRGRFRF